MKIEALQALAREQPSDNEIYKSKWQWMEDGKWRSDEARRQVDYYFSDENLLKDEHLYDKMHGPLNRPVSLSYIHGFPKMSFFPINLVARALQSSRVVKIVQSDGKDYVKRREPFYRPGDAPEDSLLDKDVDFDEEILKHQPLQPVRPPLNNQFAKKLEDASFRKTLQDFSIVDSTSNNDRAAQHAAHDGKGYVVGTAGSMRLIRTLGRSWGFRRAPPPLPYSDPRPRYLPGSNNLRPPPHYEIMADYDRRDSYRSGAGYGYGGGGKRKRYDDDEGMRPQQYARRQPPSARVRRQILAMGDKVSSRPEDDSINVAKNIIQNYEDEKFRNIIGDLILQLVLEQPMKIPFLAATILYINLEKPDFVDLITSKTASQIRSAFEQGQWRALKLVLRFLGSIQDILEGEGVFKILDELFDRAADLQSASAADALGLELVKIIMLTLPYTIAASATDLKEKVSELLEKTDIIASAPRETETVVDPFIRIEGREAPQLHSYLTVLQKQLQNEADKDWPLLIIPRLFKAVKNEEDLIEMDGPNAGQRHALPDVNIPQIISPGPTPLFPEVYFSLFADQDVETVPPTTNIAASLIRDAAVDSINNLDFNRNTPAKTLIEMDCYWAQGTFAYRQTPFDKIKDLPEGSPTWKPEDIAIDAIFSQILTLPSPEHKMVYYHAMVTETCKLAPGAIAPSLGRAIRYLYRSVDTLDQELSYRFLDWFSHHLSNFDFRWKWLEWIGDVDKDFLDPHKSFIQAAIDKEMRLSFAKRIRSTLPEEYQKLIPPSKDNEIPEYKFNNELYPFSAESKPLVQLLRRKKPDAELDEQLDKIRAKASEPEAEAASDPELSVIDALVTTICYIGSKTFSHVLSFIERQRERLLTLSSASLAARHQVIASVVDYWADVQPGVAVNIIDKLLNYGILTAPSVIEWALTSERLNGGRILAESWVYEMISRTCGKVTARVNQIVQARLQATNTSEQIEELDSTLATERQSTVDLFATIDDALIAVADGSADQVLQGGPGMLEPSEEEQELLRLWGTKWRRVFARKLAVQECIIVEGEKKFSGPYEEPVAVNGGDAEMNGNGVKPDAIDGDMDTAGEDLIS